MAGHETVGKCHLSAAQGIGLSYELRPKKEYVDFDEHCLCKTTLGLNEPLLEVDVFGF